MTDTGYGITQRESGSANPKPILDPGKPPEDIEHFEKELPTYDLEIKMYWASPNPKIHCLWANILGVTPRVDQRFHGKGSVTSDGFVMQDFTEAGGERHSGAFVGRLSDYYDTFRKWAEIVIPANDSEQRQRFMDYMNDWIGHDSSGQARFSL